MPESPFPPRAARLRRRKKALGADAEGVELPQLLPSADAAEETYQELVEAGTEVSSAGPQSEPKTEALSAPSEGPSTQDQPSEDAASTHPTTPSSSQPPKASSATPATPSNPVKSATRPTVPALPAVPVIPALPKASPKETRPPAGTEKSSAEATPAGLGDSQRTVAEEADGAAEVKASETVQPAPAPAKPKLWTGLFAKPSASAASTGSAANAAQSLTNDNAADGSGAAPGASSFAKASASSLAEALQAYHPGPPDRFAFLEPRGLVNTGNMCYMNSVRCPAQE